MSAYSIPGLESALAGLLPGDARWPCAADLDLEPVIEQLADRVPGHRATLEAIGSWGLPGRDDPEGTREVLERVSSDDPTAFGIVLLLAYGAYYADPRVLAIVQETSGYAARPPMPQGHPVVLAAPDPLPTTMGTAPSWREDGTATAAKIRQLQAEDPTRVWTLEEIWSWPTS